MTTVTTNDTVDAPATSLRRLGLKTHPAALIGRYGALVFLLLIVLIGSIMRPDTFATVSNLINILNQSSLTAIIAIGLTFVLVTGDFDVSIGYVAQRGAHLLQALSRADFVPRTWPLPSPRCRPT